MEINIKCKQLVALLCCVDKNLGIKEWKYYFGKAWVGIITLGKKGVGILDWESMNWDYNIEKKEWEYWIGKAWIGIIILEKKEWEYWIGKAWIGIITLGKKGVGILNWDYNIREERTGNVELGF